MRKYGILLTALLGVATAQTAPDQARQRAKAEIMALYRVQARALSVNNIRPIVAQWAPNLTMRSGSRTFNRQQIEASTRTAAAEYPAGLKPIIAFERFMLTKSRALVIVRFTGIMDQKNPDGTVDHVKHVTRLRDVWVRDKKRWLLEFEEDLGDTDYINGKKVDL